MCWGGVCVGQAGLGKLAPHGTVDAKETGEPLPHGGHPALAWSRPTELSTPVLNPLAQPHPPHLQPALGNSGFIVVKFPSVLGLEKKKNDGQEFV